MSLTLSSAPPAGASALEDRARNGNGIGAGASRAMRHTRPLAACALVSADVLALALVIGPAVWLVADPAPVARLLVFAGIVQIGLKMAQGLYPGFALHPEARLRKHATAWLGALIIATLGGLELAQVGMTVVGAFWAGFLGLLAVQSGGGLAVRRMLTATGAWGIAVELGGDPTQARALGAYLAAHPELGLRPVGEGERPRAILWADRGLPDPDILAILRRAHDDIILVSDLPRLSMSGVHPSDHGGGIGLRLVPARQTPSRRRLKRGFDLALAVPLSILALPIVLVSAVLIRIVDPGPAFFAQPREGLGGKTIGVLKLRTMYRDADRMLAELLQKDPAARAEWEAHFKLRDDPRVLPGIGAFLRKTSLDELPQLLNVLRGTMSMVGPRPFPGYHLDAMCPEFRTRRAMLVPGLTGLWQISERSAADIVGQEQLDDHYIAGRSFWGDLSIFLRTFAAVLGRRGAF